MCTPYQRAVPEKSDYAFIVLFRGMAALLVLVCHCVIWAGWHGIRNFNAKIAVDVFMIISGFLMTAGAHIRNREEPLYLVQNWARFWLRRFVRLAPAYYLSLGLAVVLGPWFLGGYREWQSLNPLTWTGTTVYDPARIDYSITNILLHLSFLVGLHPTYSFSTFLPDWSLSLEMQFYAVFPCLFLALRRGGIYHRVATYWNVKLRQRKFG